MCFSLLFGLCVDIIKYINFCAIPNALRFLLNNLSTYLNYDYKTV